MAAPKKRKEPFSLQKALDELDVDARAAATARLDDLLAQLKCICWPGDVIHDGSRLAYLYATAAEPLDIEDVAHELSTVHFLHNNTNYNADVQERLRAAADILHASYPRLPWPKLWKLVVHFGVPVVKYSAALQVMDAPSSAPPLAEVPVVE